MFVAVAVAAVAVVVAVFVLVVAAVVAAVVWCCFSWLFSGVVICVSDPLRRTGEGRRGEKTRRRVYDTEGEIFVLLYVRSHSVGEAKLSLAEL